MQQLFPPCPECGGTRALFKCGEMGGHPWELRLGFLNNVELYACTCLTCGHTTLRPDPREIQDLHAVVEKRGLLP